jgi:hypothetical protein
MIPVMWDMQLRSLQELSIVVILDCDHIGWFKVVKVSETIWDAFYSGGYETTYQAPNGVGYATSTDGLSWTRVAPLFTTYQDVAWRNASVWMPSVVPGRSSSNYRIWFLGSNNMTDDSWIWWKLGHSYITIIRDDIPGYYSLSSVDITIIVLSSIIGGILNLLLIGLVVLL